MTTKLELVTINDSRIIIELLSNTFTLGFVKQIKQNRELYAISSFYEIISRAPGRQWNQERINELEQLFKVSIRALNELGVNFPIQEQEIILNDNSQTRDLLNRLHRHFPTSHRSGNTWKFNSNLTFVVPLGQEKEFKKLVHDINHAVHETEYYITTEHMKTFKSRYPEYQIIFDRSKPLRDDIVAYNTGYDPNNFYFQEILPEDEQFFSDTLEYDVWLTLQQIQGKSYHVCYFDMDDPTEWDIDVNIVYSGSMSLTNRAVAKDPQIIEWLKSYGITPGPKHCGIPVGNIIQGKELVPYLKNNSIIDVIVHEV